MSEQELIYTMALTRISNFNFATALELYRRMGSATAIYEHRNDIGSIIEDCSPRLVNALKVWDEPMKRAETEMEFIKKHNILALINPLLQRFIHTVPPPFFVFILPQGVYCVYR